MYFVIMDTGLAIGTMAILLVMWRIWRAIKANMRHLTEEDIEDFLTNRMSEQELRYTREHLLKCEDCKELLDEVSKQAQKQKPERLLKRRF